MGLTMEERKQFADQGVTIYSQSMSDKEAFDLAQKGNCIVFRESVSSPGDLTVFVPESKKYRLSDIKREMPGQFTTDKNIVESIAHLLKLPVHSQVKSNTRPLIRNPDLPTPSTPVAATVMTNTFKTEMSSIRTDEQSLSGFVDALRQRDIVLKKAHVTVDEAIVIAKYTGCCILRESDSDPTGITLYLPSGEKYRLKELLQNQPEGLKDDEALSNAIKSITHFPLVTEEQMTLYNQVKSNIRPL